MPGRPCGPCRLEVLGRSLAGGVPGAVAVAAVRGPPFLDADQRLVTQRVDAGTGGQGVAHQDVEALDAGGHAAGGDAVDFRDGADAGPLPDGIAGRQVGLMGGTVGGGKLAVGGEFAVHLVHDAGWPQAARRRT